MILIKGLSFIPFLYCLKEKQNCWSKISNVSTNIVWYRWWNIWWILLTKKYLSMDAKCSILAEKSIFDWLRGYRYKLTCIATNPKYREKKKHKKQKKTFNTNSYSLTYKKKQIHSLAAYFQVISFYYALQIEMLINLITWTREKQILKNNFSVK